jgi:hypothetical protein
MRKRERDRTHLSLFELLRYLHQFGSCLGQVLAVFLAVVVLFSHLRPLQTGIFFELGEKTNRIWNTILNVDPFQPCPVEGRGGDTQLNLLKNRMDTASWDPISFDQLAHLPYPSSVLHRQMNSWSPSDAAQVARYNGHPVSTEGYLVHVKRAGPEPSNCDSRQNVDYHLVLGSSPTTPETAAVITEATPSVRAHHPGWTLPRLQVVASRHLPVQMHGWTMLDPSNEGERITPWEIHPVMQVHIWLNDTWVSLDEAKLD